MQIIKFTNINVDGCGTDIAVYAYIEGIEGKAELTNGIIERTYKAINEYKSNDEKWDTDGVIDVACKHLESEGYMCLAIVPDYEIEF